MNSKDNLNFDLGQSGNLDPELVRGNWIDSEDFKQLESELEDSCIGVARDHDGTVLEHKIF